MGYMVVVLDHYMITHCGIYRASRELNMVCVVMHIVSHDHGEGVQCVECGVWSVDEVEATR